VRHAIRVAAEVTLVAALLVLVTLLAVCSWSTELH
jgi:hypothetical protein